ncbi:MAG: hypothetical protein HOA90_13845, partial [Prolixibacteraceae bacterium]|nr:hypothetical protein [Prolixibacteraceae bacterium]
NQNEHDFLVWEYFHYNYSWKPGSENARNYLLSQAVRMGNWKGVRNNIKDNQNESIELFDLIKDGGEQNNVAEQFPEIVLKIQQIMESEHKDSEYFKK